MLHSKQFIALCLTLALLDAGCASTTVINSVPSGAKVFINGMLVGQTPVPYTDTKIVGTNSTLTLKKEGCKEVSYVLSRTEEVNVAAIVGGVFCLFPFLWTMSYQPSRTYELSCDGAAPAP